MSIFRDARVGYEVASMWKKVLVAGLLGWLVLIAWGFIINGMFGLNASINLNKLDKEEQVYEVLLDHVVAPGRYVVNPPLTPERNFPEGEPVFSVMYSGVGHETAGAFQASRLAANFLIVLVAVWMLSQASDRVLASYPRKVMFFAAIGLLFALFMDLGSAGIGGYPVRDAARLALIHVVMWTVVGMAVAWRLVKT